MKAIWTLLFCFALKLSAQNLVSNGSFEEFSTCPSMLGDMMNCNSWWSARGTCDYYNSCNTDNVISTPFNIQGYQPPLSGEAYGGIVCYTTSQVDIREHLECALASPLLPNTEYFFSFYASVGFQLPIQTKACNRLGLKVTNELFSSSNPSPLDNSSIFSTTEILADTSRWYQIRGSFIPDQEYNYILIGNFYDDLNTDTLSNNNLWYGESYYYIDEVRISTDSTFSYVPLEIKSNPLSAVQIVQNTPDFVSIQSNLKFNQVQIISLDGKVVAERLELLSNYLELDCAFLGSGIYLCKIYFEDKGFKTYKILLQ